MLSDDTYRAKMVQTIAAVKAWTGFVADVARIEEEHQSGAWRLALAPKSPKACPVEILLRDDQKYDLTLGGATYEDQPAGSLDLVLPLLQAVVEGRVITRRTFSAITGLPRSIGTVVALADGTVLEEEIELPGASRFDGERVEARDTHFLPYRPAGK